jgi:hypothetical protein
MVSEVQFPGAEGERLAGTLVVPGRPGLHAAALVLSGSGPVDLTRTGAARRSASGARSRMPSESAVSRRSGTTSAASGTRTATT